MERVVGDTPGSGRRDKYDMAMQKARLSICAAAGTMHEEKRGTSNTTRVPVGCHNDEILEAAHSIVTGEETARPRQAARPVAFRTSAITVQNTSVWSDTVGAVLSGGS